MATRPRSILGLSGIPLERQYLQTLQLVSQVLDAHLTVRLFEILRPSPISQYARAQAINAGVSIDQTEQVLEKAADQLRQTLADGSNRNGGDRILVASSSVMPAELDIAAAQAAHYADLVILPALEPDSSSVGYHALHGALMSSGAPVLVLPKVEHDFKLPRSIAIAWDESVHASRAVRAALALLETGATVHVITVDDGKRSPEAATNLKDWLDRHDVAQVAIQTIGVSSQSVAQALGNACGQLGVDMMVMGGYGHSRLRERLFGGTTREILLDPPVPVLVVH